MKIKPTTPESFDGAGHKPLTREEWLNLPTLQRPTGQKTVQETLGPLTPVLQEVIERINQVKP